MDAVVSLRLSLDDHRSVLRVWTFGVWRSRKESLLPDEQ